LTAQLDMQFNAIMPVSSSSLLARRTALRLGVVLGAGVGLGGCGFRPLYGSSGVAANPGVVEALAQTRIRPIPDRSGQRLRQVLNEKLYANGPAQTGAFDLEVTLTKQTVELGVRPDSTTSRANLIVYASFVLYEAGARVFADAAQGVVSYNILDDQFSTVASQSDAEDRALQQVGEDIKVRLSVYFDRRLKPRTVQRATR
jgi:LPS-assembly lipoprotein